MCSLGAGGGRTLDSGTLTVASAMAIAEPVSNTDAIKVDIILDNICFLFLSLIFYQSAVKKAPEYPHCFIFDRVDAASSCLRGPTFILYACW